MTAFIAQSSVESRMDEYERLMAKYPNSVALVAECATTAKTTLLTVPRDATVKGMEEAVRQAMGISRKKLTLTIDGCSPAATATAADLQEACKKADGFLYVSYSTEKVMGGVSGPCYSNDMVN